MKRVSVYFLECVWKYDLRYSAAVETVVPNVLYAGRELDALEIPAAVKRVPFDSLHSGRYSDVFYLRFIEDSPFVFYSTNNAFRA